VNIDFTTTALLESIKRRAMIPASQVLFTDAELLSVLTEELHADIVPLILSVREDFFLYNHDQSIDASENKYAIHARAFGQKLKDAVLLNSDGKEVDLPRSNPSSLKKEQSKGTFLSSGPTFYFEGDEVVIYPDTSNLGSMSLRMKIYRRPNNLVAQSAAGQITAVDTSLKTITLSNLPSAWAAGDDVDVIKGQPGFKSRGDDQDVASIVTATKTLTMTAAIPDGTAVGDWVSLAGDSPIPQIPYEVHNILAQRGAIKVLESLGDASGLQAAADVYTDMVDKFKITVTPRADDSPKRLVSSSPLFGDNGRSSGWW